MRKRMSKKPRARMLRTIFPVFLCALLSAPSGSTQRGIDPPCTSLELLCPAHVVSAADPITLRADVLGGKEVLGEDGLGKLDYEWQVTGATIISGNGTSELVIKADAGKDSEYGCIDIKLQVKGLPPTCESVKTCKLRINYKCGQVGHVDEEYGDISWPEEVVHLDKIAQTLSQRGPRQSLYVVTYAGRNACISEAQWRGERVRRYLKEAQHVEADRIISVNGGFREQA